MRWRHLRSGTGALESIVWQYRTRTGPFAPSETSLSGASGAATQHNAAEKMLCHVLNEWREQLVTGAALATTNLERHFKPSTFTHHQDCPAAGSELKAARELKPLDDDFHSPAKPDRYICLRVEVMLRFYRTRIPRFASNATRKRPTPALASSSARSLACMLAQVHASRALL